MPLFSLSHEAVADVEREENLSRRLRRRIRTHRKWYIFQGMAFLFFGFLAVYLPLVAALSATYFTGFMLLTAGILQLAVSVGSSMQKWALLSAALSAFAGAWIIYLPAYGASAMVVILAYFLAAKGACEIRLALELRPLRHWEWMLASGLTALSVSCLLWTGFPTLNMLFLGMMIAAIFVCYGLALLKLAWRVR